MDKAVKDGIKEALEAFLIQQDMTQNVFSENCGVNGLYLKGIRDGSHTYSSKGVETPIADKWYYKVADYIGFKINKNYWETKATDQFLRILATLEDARKFGSTNVIIGETGCGKSYACDLFQKKYRQDVFIIKLGQSDKIGDVLDKTIEALKMPVRSNVKLEGSKQTASKSNKIRRIIQYLQKLKLEGFNPTVIWDESEYMNIATLCAIKEFYDALRKVAALILIGTEQLLDNLERMKRSNKQGMPQFYSRIKFGIRELKPIDRKFVMFLDNVEDKSVKDFVKTNCENYREVHDLLVPAMREADVMNIPLNVDLICNMLGRGGY